MHNTVLDLLNPAPGPRLDEEFVGLPMDLEFLRMQCAYGSTGGLARGDDLARWLEDLQPGAFSHLARRILSGEIFAFRWHDEYWVPRFQLDPIDLSVKPVLRRVLAELAGVFDGWTLATWFAARNSWLDNRRPVALLDSDLSAVLEAARADRFIASGFFKGHAWHSWLEAERSQTVPTQPG